MTSAICDPPEGATLPEGASSVTVKGFAWSGGGRAITRVDVSADGGRTWLPTEITAAPADSSPSQRRSWGWSLWSAEVPLPPLQPPSSGSKGGAEVQLVCKAVDSSYNVQPELPGGIWNFRGLLNNSWHRVNVTVPAAAAAAAAVATAAVEPAPAAAPTATATGVAAPLR